MRTHYNNLRVPENADSETIKVAYKQLVQKWHPDKHPEGIEKRKAERVFSIITSAYEVLSDEYRRKEYDHFLLSERMHYATTPKDIIKHDHKIKPTVLFLGNFSLKSIFKRITPDIIAAIVIIGVVLFFFKDNLFSGEFFTNPDRYIPFIIMAAVIFGLLVSKFFYTKVSSKKHQPEKPLPPPPTGVRKGIGDFVALFGCAMLGIAALRYIGLGWLINDLLAIAAKLVSPIAPYAWYIIGVFALMALLGYLIPEREKEKSGQ